MIYQESKPVAGVELISYEGQDFIRIPEQRIAARTEALAAQLSKIRFYQYYPQLGNEVTVMGIMPDALLWQADFMRALGRIGNIACRMRTIHGEGSLLEDLNPHGAAIDTDVDGHNVFVLSATSVNADAFSHLDASLRQRGVRTVTPINLCHQDNGGNNRHPQYSGFDFKGSVAGYGIGGSLAPYLVVNPAGLSIPSELLQPSATAV